MSPLFGNKAEKAAQKAAASAEFERLNALPGPDLAVEVMPAFGPDGPKAARGTAGLQIIQVLTWLVRSEPRGMEYMSKLQQPAREAIQLLINAGLIANAGPGKTKSTYWCATRQGETALAEGTVRKYL
jgi:hypothetical protein